jgi:Cys-tRNA(Pro) deacylase
MFYEFNILFLSILNIFHASVTVRSLYGNFIMTKQTNFPETPATKFLRQHGVLFSRHLYHYEEHGGTKVSARELGVDEHSVVKTLIMEDESSQPLIMLMHGDCKVSTKELARQVACKRIEPCKPEVANRHTGFLVGGTSPFGTKKRMPVYMERTILDLPLVYINGGRRGFLISIPPQPLIQILEAHLVEAALR